MVQLKSKILYKQKITNKHFYLIIEGGSIIKDSCPGKFLEIKVNNSDDPLLRRPFGIHRIQGNNLGVMFEVAGKGTQILSEKKVGEYLDIIGPLGNGFDYQSARSKTQRIVLIAGGMGVAPLLFLAEELKRSKKYQSQVIVFIGAKTKEFVLCEKDFRGLGCAVKIAADDGSKGFKGKVTDLLKQFLRTADRGHLTIYACGPKPMLQELSVISDEHNIPAQLSLEAHMACGIGVCLGCAVNTTHGIKRVCKEGPVFSADEIVW